MQTSIDLQFEKIQKEVFRIEKIGTYNLDAITKAYRLLGLNKTNAKYIHIAGTNGKGSVANMVYSILQENKRSVGLFTSPHLVDIRERFQCNGEMISKKEFIDIVEKITNLHINLSFFEMAVLIALEFFSNHNVGYIIMEVGVGGRLDSTNIINPTITAITSIGIDHQDLLGESIEEIAKEKAGIIKSGIPIIINKKNTVIESVAEGKKSKIIYSTIHETNLSGEHQKKNAGIAFEIAKYLSIPMQSIKNGLQKVRHPGRMDLLTKNILIDGAHNIDGLKSLKQYIDNHLSHFQSQELCINIKAGKKIENIIDIFFEYDRFTVVDVDNTMTEKAYYLSKKMKNANKITTIKTPYQIIQEAKKYPEKVFIVFGSLYMIGSFYAL